jgi:hypothetical protein
MLIHKIKNYLTNDHHIFTEARMISMGIDKPKANVSKVNESKDKPVSIWENLQNLGNKITKLISSVQKDPNLTKKIQKLADRANKIQLKVEGRKKTLSNKILTGLSFDKNGKPITTLKSKENKQPNQKLPSGILDLSFDKNGKPVTKNSTTTLVKGLNDIKEGKSKITKGDLDSI